jgi:GT2 family glycosyltransferase
MADKRKINNPLVTVNILSFNRKDELLNTLQKVYEQDYKNIEVIVVDNASTDGSPEMVESEFPEVKLIRLNENIGIAGWNKGFEEAKGEYVLVLDDDSYPEKGAIKRAVEVFKKNENVGIVAFIIYNFTFGFYETENWTDEPFAFVGCGALISKEKLDKVGYFDENIFIYLNELDLTARFLDKGYRTLLCKECLAIHSQSLLSRKGFKNPFANKYRYNNFFWSMSYFLLTKFSFPLVLLPFGKWLLNRLIIILRYFYFIPFLKGIFTIVIKMKVIFKNRQPLKKTTQKFYKNGNFFPFVDRDFYPQFKRKWNLFTK